MGILSVMLIFNFAQAPTRPVRPTGKELSCGRFSTFSAFAPRHPIDDISHSKHAQDGTEEGACTFDFRTEREEVLELSNLAGKTVLIGCVKCKPLAGGLQCRQFCGHRKCMAPEEGNGIREEGGWEA